MDTRTMSDGFKALSKGGKYLPKPQHSPITSAAEKQIRYLAPVLLATITIISIASAWEGLKNSTFK